MGGGKEFLCVDIKIYFNFSSSGKISLSMSAAVGWKIGKLLDDIAFGLCEETYKVEGKSWKNRVCRIENDWQGGQ